MCRGSEGEGRMACDVPSAPHQGGGEGVAGGTGGGWVGLLHGSCGSESLWGEGGACELQQQPQQEGGRAG